MPEAPEKIPENIDYIGQELLEAAWGERSAMGGEDLEPYFSAGRDSCDR
jgi:hypothetical protein